MDIQEPSMQLLAEAAQSQNPLPDVDDQDNRSSSLSDIEDNNESEGEGEEEEAESDNDLSLQISEQEVEEEEEEEDREDEEEDEDEDDEEANERNEDNEENDTEAETERLEESPDKPRKQKKVLLNANNESTNINATPLKELSLPEINGDQEGDDDKDEAQSDIENATSPISSPAESADEASPPGSPLSSASRKRKRASETSPSTKRAAMQLLKNTLGDDLTKSKKDAAEFVIKTANGRHKIKGAELLIDSAAESPADNATEEAEDAPEEEAEGAESNDDVDMDEAAPEAETGTKSEGDLAMRKEAADKVSNIEEQFAIFRDRMYGEAVANINAELASLDKDDPTHPEYLAISAAITRQSQARIALARSRFSLQVKNWQKRGLAEQAQYYSQYAQACRDIRDGALTKASDEWYQIQKGRRAVDDSIALVSLSSFKRVDLIAQQTAYNTEVSILSGIAKHVGFPAAPELFGATQSEIEEDLKSLGTTLQAQQSHVSSSISQYLRQNLAAEKQFSKVTPWANAQHHAHGLHAGYSWSPARPNSPFTPATQSQYGEVPVAVGSASTIIGSLAPTPLSSEIAGSNSKSKTFAGNFGETPSRNPQSDRPRSVVQTHGFNGPRAKMQAEGTPNSRIGAEYSPQGKIAPELKIGVA